MSKSSLPLGRFFLVGCLATSFAFLGACSDDPTVEDGDKDGTGNGKDGSGGTGGKPGPGVNPGDIDPGSGNSGSGASGNGDGEVCESSSEEAELDPIYLAFAFDVSGSMGKLDQPYWWHDPAKKWEPVSKALHEFFSSEEEDISASLTLFPAKSNKCSSSSYVSPQVPMSGLGDSQFSKVIDDYEDEVRVSGSLAGGNWRGDTPTLQVVQGTFNYLEQLSEMPEYQGKKMALVLVTDGLPQGCSGNTVSNVADEVAKFKDKFPTYVVGIENPTSPPSSPPAGWGGNWGRCSGSTISPEPCPPPDTLGALNEIAEAGGSGEAILIDTEKPAETTQKLLSAINDIRKKELACEFAIPEHPEGGEFNADRINVSLSVSGEKTNFLYNAECGGTAEQKKKSWRYDDEESPSRVVLCEESCKDVRARTGADILVEFLCEDRSDDFVVTR